MALIEAFKQLLGDTAVLTREEDLAGLTEDWRGRFRAPALCAVLPSTTEQVAAIVRLCVAHETPVLPQGGNTSLCGGATPSGQGKPPVIVALTRMRRIRSLDPVNKHPGGGCRLRAGGHSGDRRRCGPALSGESRRRRGPARSAAILAPMPEAPACSATATRATMCSGWRWSCRTDRSGTAFTRCARTTPATISSIFFIGRGYPRHHHRCGAEVDPLPTAEAVAWLAVDDPQKALDVLGLFQASCSSRLSAFELMNAKQIRLVLSRCRAGAARLRRSTPGTSSSNCLIPRCRGARDDDATVLEQALEAGLVSDGVVAASEAQRKAMWLVRHSVSEANRRPAWA